MTERATAGHYGDPAVADHLARRLGDVSARIRRASNGNLVPRVIAVTKGFGVEVARAVASAGLVDLGESYAGELMAKAERIEDQRNGPRWHFLGAVQRNKVRRLAPYVHLWHSVTRPEEGCDIARWAPGAAVLVQVSPAPDRRGVSPWAVEGLVARLVDLGLDVRGLMAVGPPGPPEEARPGYRRLAELAAALGLAELSMGMSADLEVAVSEGATIVRLGRALLGPRPEPKDLRDCSLAGGG